MRSDATLSDRTAEVLALAQQGLTAKQISTRLGYRVELVLPGETT